MTGAPLACTVRGCGLALERQSRAFACARGHTYDVARRGYVNLLQPQDRRSSTAGDSKAAVDARAALLVAGIGRIILDGFVQKATALAQGAAPVAVDLGCGAGDALGELARKRGPIGVGIDLSAPAIERAAARFPALTWVVANADRRLPVLERSADLVLSLHGRRHPAECSRVMTAGGHLLVAVPAHDDLIELRAEIQGSPMVRDRSAALIAEHNPWFALVERSTCRERHVLEAESLRLLLRGTYRGRRLSTAGRVSQLSRLEVTLASDLFVFAPR